MLRIKRLARRNTSMNFYIYSYHFVSLLTSTDILKLFLKIGGFSVSNESRLLSKRNSTMTSKCSSATHTVCARRLTNSAFVIQPMYLSRVSRIVVSVEVLAFRVASIIWENNSL